MADIWSKITAYLSGAWASAAANAQNMPWVKIGLGIGTVFLGLICIVILCKLIGLLCKERKKTANAAVPATEAPDKAERQKIVAAVTAACAEYMGKDVKALRVISFKKL